LLQTLGKTTFVKADYYWRERGLSKAAVLSSMVAHTFPIDKDAPEEFTRQMRAAVSAGAFPEDRLLELAFHAPQWVKHIEAYFDWPGFQEAIWWFLAHMSAYVGDLGDIESAEPASNET